MSDNINEGFVNTLIGYVLGKTVRTRIILRCDLGLRYSHVRVSSPKASHWLKLANQLTPGSVACEQGRPLQGL